MKILNKQNFVKVKITKYEGISFAIIFIMIELIYVKITLVCESEHSFYEASFIFSLLRKFCVKQGCKGMAFDALTLEKIE